MSDPEPPRVPPYASFSLGPAVIDHHPFPSLGFPDSRMISESEAGE